MLIIYIMLEKRTNIVSSKPNVKCCVSNYVQATMAPLYVYCVSCNDLSNIKLYSADFVITHCKESLHSCTGLLICVT